MRPMGASPPLMLRRSRAGLPPPRIVTGAAFLALWTPGEIAAAIAADPRLLAGAFEALAQNSVNLDSPRAATLLALAVERGVIDEARRDQILAGQPPGA
jgi:hypothetical protein